MRTETATDIKRIEGSDCPKGKTLIATRTRHHLATRKTATNKTAVLMLVKSKNCRQLFIPRIIAE